MAPSTAASKAAENDHMSAVETRMTPVKTSSRTEGEENAAHSPLSHRFRSSTSRATSEILERSRGSPVAVVLSGSARPWQHQAVDGGEVVESVLAEKKDLDDGVRYVVEYESGKKEEVSFWSVYHRSISLILLYHMIFYCGLSCIWRITSVTFHWTISFFIYWFLCFTYALKLAFCQMSICAHSCDLVQS